MTGRGSFFLSDGMRRWAPRVIGLGILTVLLLNLDRTRIVSVLREAEWELVILSAAGLLPFILLKTFRWVGILRIQNVALGLGVAYSAYFASIFLGLVTPGKIGELLRAVYLSRDAGVPSAQAFASVVADRLFDLYMLVAVGAVAALVMTSSVGADIAVAGVVLGLVAPLVLLLNDRTFGAIRRAASCILPEGRWLLQVGKWIDRVRAGFRRLTGVGVVKAAIVTVASFLLFFSQCYLLARAVNLPVGWIQVALAVSVGSLVGLVPVSVAGLGTREAAIVGYLAALGVEPEAALTFSLLIFLVFHVGTSCLGLAAWLRDPVPIPGRDAQG